MAAYPVGHGDRDEWRGPAPPPDVLIGGLAPPKVTYEEGVFIVRMAFDRPLADLRFRADSWSVRIWLEGQRPPLPREVLFAGRINPKMRVVRVSRGILEIRFADAEMPLDASIEPSGTPFD